MPDAVKRAYLRKLHAAGPTTEAERHELEHADNVFGCRWWMAAWEVRWYENADRLAACYEEYGRWPRRASQVRSEQLLASWLSRARNQLASGLMAADRLSYLNRVAPGWETLQSRGRPRGAATMDGMECARDLIDFVAAHRVLPRQVCNEPTESRLGNWLTNQRAKRKRDPNLDDPIWTYLDSRLPGWDTPQKRGPRQNVLITGAAI